MSNDAHERMQKPRTPEKRPAVDALDEEFVKDSPGPAAQKAVLNPAALSPGAVLQLQRTLGNQAVRRLIAGERTASTDAPADVIQRRGTYNPISIQQAGNVNAIEEQEHGSGATVTFTSITSCVGFLARSGNQVYGLHLGVMDANSVNVSTVNLQNLAAAVGAVWPANPDAVFQVGMVNNWDSQVLNGLYPTLLTADEMSADLNSSGKIYSATVNAQGKMEVRKDNVLIYTEP